MAVRVGNPHGIADGFARIDRSPCWPAFAAGLGIQSIDLLPNSRRRRRDARTARAHDPAGRRPRPTR